jgi:hypothetical protein
VRPGTNIPVVYDRARPRQVEIPWDDIGTTVPELAQAATAIAAALRVAAPAPAPRPPDPLDVLERLGALHAAGALSDAEFAAEKARVLGEP